MLTNPRPEVVEVGRLELSPGAAQVVGLVTFRGNAVVGAEVFVGCRKTATDFNSTFRISVPASPLVAGKPEGDQLIRAQAYWTEPPGMLHATRKVPLGVGLNDLTNDPIQLDPPPEWRRRVEIHGRLNMVHQVMFGHDTYDAVNVSDSVFVQVDPMMDTAAYRDAATAARSSPFDFRTNRCGGERAHFSGTVSLFDPGQPPPPEGPNAVLVSWVYEILDGDDDSEKRVDSQAGTLVVAAGTTGRLQPSLDDGDEPPDRAQSDMYIDNLTNFA
jgi:hypothetical protein